ncbi:ScbA/BarX family gamma-butyrolactone biosynthesis protein [Streptomyces sp. NPDC047079]|uniref:ScbA/BarX family gamma-butyrolactone biosynthesis protein n=1 Tax=Streptomyces sp. NPDC047079 TaxID=3154607 RepID=UPI0033FEE3EE
MPVSLQSAHDTFLARHQHLPPAAVHKAVGDQVLLTDARQIGDNRFLVAALWPGDHLLYQPDSSGSGDPNFVLESVRQAAIHLSHRFFGIPDRGWAFVLSRFEVDVTSPRLPHVAGAAVPTTLDISCTHTERRSGSAAMSIKADVIVDGVRHAYAAVRWNILPARQYAALRMRNRPTPTATSRNLATLPTIGVSPEVVGRRRSGDVLLAEAAGLPDQAWVLAMDRTHPVFFDHESDHIPGMVLIEAVRQAAHAADTRLAGPARGTHPSCLVADFECFCDLDAPVLVAATNAAHGHRAFIVTVEQGDRTVVRAHLTFPARGEASAC